MSGHSKWANIKVKKTAQDSKRGKVFTRHAKLIEIAAREGGGSDPDTNPRLRVAIDGAREDNVPNANIERAVKKGSGELKDAAQTVALVYEAYGPAGTAYIIECLTDNKNRTLPNIKTIIAKQGGRFAEGGSVAWLFEQKGIVVAKRKAEETALPESVELKVIDAGADDIVVDENGIEIPANKDRWSAVRDVLKTEGYTIESSGLQYCAKDPVLITDAESAKKVLQFMEALEEEEDVSEVYTNADIEKELAATLG